MQLPSTLFLALFTLGVATISAQTQTIPDSLLKGSNAVVLYEKYDVKHEKYDNYVLEYSTSIKILNKKAKHLQNVYFHFKDGSEKLSDMNISVLDANDKLLQKVKSKEIKDYATGDGYSIITDQRIKHWSYTTNSYPITISYSYKKQSKNTLLLPMWTPLPSEDVSVLESTYKVETDAILRIKEMNLDRYPNIKKEGFQYSIRNQKSLNKEKYSPSYYEIVPLVIICPKKFSYEGIDGSIDNWSDYGKWMYNSFLDNKELPSVEAIKNELAGIIKPNDTDESIIKKVYDFVQKNTRYISVSLDEGGFSPLDPAKVHEVKYGDCKALSFYTKVLLESYGITANYTEVHASSQMPQGVFSDFACALPGNHIILNIPMGKDTSWLDCTSHSNPYNFLGTFTDNRQAISIEKSGGKLVHTPSYSTEKNKSQDSIYLDITSADETKVHSISCCAGLAMQSDLRMYYKSQKEKEDYYKERVYGKYNVRKITDIDIELDEEKGISNMSIDFTIAPYAEISGDYTFIPKTIASLNIPKLKKDKNRINKIYFPRGHIHSSVLIIKTKGEAEIVEDPSLSIDSDYGSYTSNVSKSSEGYHTFSRQFELKEGTYSAEDYNKIKKFLDKVHKIEQTPITLLKL